MNIDKQIEEQIEKAMNINKQIDEMARDLCGNDVDCKKCATLMPCFSRHFSKRAVEKGYRKAYDVAREIFEDIFYHTYYSHGRLIIEHSTLLALQKKYTEEGK